MEAEEKTASEEEEVSEVLNRHDIQTDVAIDDSTEAAQTGIEEQQRVV